MLGDDVEVIWSVGLWRHVVVIDLNKKLLEIRKGFFIPSQIKTLDLEHFTHIGIRCRCISLLTALGSRFIIYIITRGIMLIFVVQELNATAENRPR